MASTQDDGVSFQLNPLQLLETRITERDIIIGTLQHDIEKCEQEKAAMQEAQSKIDRDAVRPPPYALYND